MESTSTSFSSLASCAEGHSKSYLNDGSNVHSTVVSHSPTGSGENNNWKGSQYFDPALHSAVSRGLSSSNSDSGNNSDMQVYNSYVNQVGIKLEKNDQQQQHHIWNSKRNLSPDAKGINDEMHQNFLSALEVVQQNSSGEAQDLAKRHDEQQSVARHPSVKMEYAMSDGHLRDHHASVLSSLHPEIIVPSHSQQVEVIQKTGQHNQSLSHHIHALSPKDSEGNVLQIMEKMQVPVPAYDPSALAYHRQSALYNTSKGANLTHLYDCGSGSAYGGLPGLPSTQHLLPSGYSNLLATTQDYYVQRPDYYATAVRPLQAVYPDCSDDILDRLGRPSNHNLYKPVTVDLPSPVDSGIGQEVMITPKQEAVDGIFTYTDLQQSVVQQLKTTGKDYHSRLSCNGDRHIVSAGRDSPIHIPKIMTSFGFQYTLEAPVSTSVRRDDDRMTYVNKGQFYTISLEYIPDPNKPLKSSTVKSVLMVVFREEKSPEEEVKCWQFWHTRQHSAKQRILDIDTKNSVGLIGSIEEISHNGVCFYWSVNEQPVKVNVAVQCLSTDFSNQKGVKGLPLHIQIDTFDEAHSKNVPFHRGYCQIKVFCDKGANRKMLHEQRREEKRKITGRKKSDGEFHESCERSEFYHMSNLTKPAVLFIPPEDYDRFPPLESFYSLGDNISSTMLKDDDSTNSSASPSPPLKKQKVYPTDRVMIYVKKDEEHIFTPLHLTPPSVDGLLEALSEKYSMHKEKIAALYKQSTKGIIVKMDDEMVHHYCNEDTFLLQCNTSEDDSVTVTLIELCNTA